MRFCFKKAVFNPSWVMRYVVPWKSNFLIGGLEEADQRLDPAQPRSLTSGLFLWRFILVFARKILDLCSLRDLTLVWWQSLCKCFKKHDSILNTLQMFAGLRCAGLFFLRYLWKLLVSEHAAANHSPYLSSRKSYYAWNISPSFPMA
jgi:hypothetical protein